MRVRPSLIAAASALLIGGCRDRGRADGPLVAVTASYPGAGARSVAEAVAAPIEQQINGVEGMVRIESESRDNGRYVARLRFKTGTDPDLVVALVRNRVALAKPILPEEVRRAKVLVTPGVAAGEPPAAIALIDRADLGLEALRRRSAVVMGRIVADGSVVKPEAFPGPDVTRTIVRIDRSKCAALGLTEAAVQDAAQAAGPSAKVDALMVLRVNSAKGEEIPLGAVVAFEEVTGPATVYRVNLYPSVRIGGFPPEGKTAAWASARWAELAEAGRRDGFGVEDLTAN